jgi:glutathione peroxidase
MIDKNKKRQGLKSRLESFWYELFSYHRPFSKLSFVIIPLLIFGIAQTTSKSIHSFTAKSIDGDQVNLSQYKGKVLIVVNVASKSPLTIQYEALQKFYKEYEGKGVVILAFPSNSYKGELGTDKEIRSFCRSKYKVTFPMFSKVEVKGKNQHPVFKYLSNKAENGVMDAPANWDFQKYILNKKGKLVKTIDPNKDIYDAEAIATINKLIKEGA